MVPIMGKENKESNPNTGIIPTVTTSNVSDNVNRNRDSDDDDFSSTVKDVTLGDFNKFVRIQDTLEKSIERRNERHQPVMSFGEKLGTKIEERMTDGMIDKMMGSMFNLGGTQVAKQEGWLSVVKTILDSGFAQQAGAKLPETIAALKSTIGEERTNALADAAISAIGPKKEKAVVSVEEEQKKMERFVLGLNSVSIVDIKKFMELVNANPSNNKLTDITQARNILIEEQNRIRRENPVLANEVAIDNQDKDTGIRQQPFGSSIDRFPSDPMNNMMPRDARSMQNNQLDTEQILSLDPNNDMSVESFAWSSGYGNMLSEPNGIQKVRKLLMIKQDEITRQLSGLGGDSVGTGIGQEQEQSVETESESGDMKWDNEDIGKKGVGKGRRVDDKDVIVPPGVAKADSPVESNKESANQNNAMMELLQKMAQNFDNGVSELNNKLQMMETRIAKVETVNNVIPNTVIESVVPTPENVVSDITVNEENIRAVMNVEFEDEDNATEDDNTDDNVADYNTEKVEEEVVEEIAQEKDITNTNEAIEESKVHVKAPVSSIDNKEETKEEIPKEIKTNFPVGSQGWLRQQKEKNKNKGV